MELLQQEAGREILGLPHAGKEVSNRAIKKWNMQIVVISYRQPAVLTPVPQLCSTSKIVFQSLIFFLQLPFLPNNQLLANNHQEEELC